MDRTRSELYHRQNTLIATGTGVIILALWSFLKMVLYLTMAKSNAMEMMESANTEGINKDVLYIAVSVAIMIILVIDTIVKIYVGRCAWAEGHGKRKSGLYLFLAWCMVIFGAYSIVNMLHTTVVDIGAAVSGETVKGNTGIGDNIASIILESVAMFITIGLIRSARYIRKARKSEEGKG